MEANKRSQRQGGFGRRSLAQYTKNKCDNFPQITSQFDGKPRNAWDVRENFSAPTVTRCCRFNFAPGRWNGWQERGVDDFCLVVCFAGRKDSLCSGINVERYKGFMYGWCVEFAEKQIKCDPFAQDVIELNLCDSVGHMWLNICRFQVCAFGNAK